MLPSSHISLLKIMWNFHFILLHLTYRDLCVLLQITVILLKDEEAYSLSLIIKSSVGGLLVLIVIIVILVKVSSPHVHEGSGVGQNSA